VCVCVCALSTLLFVARTVARMELDDTSTAE